MCGGAGSIAMTSFVFFLYSPCLFNSLVKAICHALHWLWWKTHSIKRFEFILEWKLATLAWFPRLCRLLCWHIFWTLSLAVKLTVIWNAHIYICMPRLVYFDQYFFRFLFSMSRMEFDVNYFQVVFEKYRNEKHLLQSVFFKTIIESLKTIQATSFPSCLWKYTVDMMNAATGTSVDWIKHKGNASNASNGCLVNATVNLVGLWCKKIHKD